MSIPSDSELQDILDDFSPNVSKTGNNKGKFVVRKITSLKDLKEKSELPQSDLTIQLTKEDAIIQFDYEENENEETPKIQIKPGCFNFSYEKSELVLKKIELREYKLLKSIDSSKIILAEADKFFSRLHVYEKRKREPKRAILLCSLPGAGKSSNVNTVCRQFLKEPGTTVIIWDTSSIKSSEVNEFFINDSVFAKDVKKLILVIEDIEGGVTENDGGYRKTSESSLLNLLDGVGRPFKGVPTFIMGTTNNPENSVGALVDRPGRFDKVIELKTPNAKEFMDLLKFMLEKDVLDEKEIKSAEIAAKNVFSIAHLQECVDRCDLDDITIDEAVDQLVNHKKRFKDAFITSTKGPLGLG